MTSLLCLTVSLQTSKSISSVMYRLAFYVSPVFYWLIFLYKLCECVHKWAQQIRSRRMWKDVLWGLLYLSQIQLEQDAQMISPTPRTSMLLHNWTSQFLILQSSVTCNRNGGMKEPLSIFFPKINMANSKRQLINFYWKCLQSISSSQPQWWLSSPASFDPALQFSLCLLFSTLNPPLAPFDFCGPGPLWVCDPCRLGRKKGGGDY